MSIINNGLSGSIAAQAALSAASQNIANVMTPGYTRQGAVLASVQPLQSGTKSAGSGVAVSSLMRFSDDYKNMQMWRAASELSSRSTVQPYLDQLEQVMGDDSSGINNGLDGFFSALNAASVEPSSVPLRAQVINAADALAQRFNSLTTVLANQRSAVAQQRTSLAAQINTTTTQIADLNKRISLAEASGVNASGLIDARDSAIDSLAGHVAIQVVDDASGARNVSLKSGQPLVVGSTASRLEVTDNASGTQTLSLHFANEVFAVRDDNLGGQLGGLADFEYGILAPLRQSISDIASEVSTLMNTQLTAGYALDGSPGSALFVFDPSSSTSLLSVTAGVLPQDLGFSSDPSKPGNSDNLLAMIELKNQSINVTSLGAVRIGDAHTQLIGRLGMDSQQNRALMATATTVRNQAEESWKSTSGVNNDEEAVNLIQFQQMYQANMKVIAVANELFDSTLAMMR
ncbi:MAG: flagellar hook-associated protein FlgK [Gammaproteobacteria bacterium]|jgi:flagellar hook-associated protein 1|nr:flagellar hook-associated protein FlgK [Gammaproteobacteria bacterium]MBU0773466.1 flagellar hook-associated protein FlgK [Gammaproteobacteria bacterium]MBU0856676.1 flagellar hook-associated protein FlgK [Gammaproteobacteria bacterium]MBU1846794.1 flagellar hook-associated protein FlgK [Gammaproteobacteria bacterium]